MSKLEADVFFNENDLVWHYTSGSALQNIISKSELWASNTAFMNDTHERRLGRVS
ncbi:hypothetical protein [Pseudarthrobacter oxydans]|uniref:hypothetical protein n=1 Tax=Pseudarthrobacter oxydans TaxID=1671 RepID=UPI0037F8F3B5